MQYDLDAFKAAIAGIEHTDDPLAIRRKSRDRYGVSPLLRQMLDGKVADIVVTPRTRDEVVAVARAAVRHRIPVTPRGGGTANYGQSVPLKGGIVLDMTEYAGVVALGGGIVRARAGTIVADIDTAARATGWELRIHPTTKRWATIGGFVMGGSGGPGSVVHGYLHERGNIAAAEIVTMEDAPRVLELEGRDAQLVHHTYGATGIVTEVAMPLEPAWRWREAIVAFPAYMDAVRFGVGLGNASGITKKLVSIQDWPTPSLIAEYARVVPEGHAVVSTLIAERSWTEFAQFVAASGGAVVSDHVEGSGPYGPSLTEFAFGHALWHVQKTDPRRAMIEGFLRAPDLTELIERVWRAVGGYGPMRMELVRAGGELCGTGSPYFVYESPEQMAALVRAMQAAGAHVSNSHTSNVRAVGKKEITSRDSAFKRAVDPYGLLNPGRFEADPDADATFALTLPTDAWHRRIA
ncbi:MAG: FAD-binding oxidoreductase [Alphaproteobacteria bacterium]